jgi:hypothetical protein
MGEIKRGLSTAASNVWIGHVWSFLRRFRGIGWLASPAAVPAYGKKWNPTLPLKRVNGQLVLMSRNQTMKMLIQATQAPHQDGLLSLLSRVAG